MPRSGRPTKINDVIATRPVVDDQGLPTGEYHEITVLEQIVSDIRTGMYAERAAKRAGIAKSTFYDWEKRGRTAARSIEAGQTTISKLSALDRRCLEFSDAVERAEIEWETRANTDLERLARGQIPVRETVTKVDTEGKVIEKRTKESVTLPDAGVLEWRLERRFPDRYGRRTAVEHSGPGGGAVQVQVQAEQVVLFARGLLDDLGIAFTDDVRQVVASRLRGMAAIEAGSSETSTELADA